MRGRAKQAEDEAEMLYRALAAFFRGRYDYPTRDRMVRSALAAYESTHPELIDGLEVPE